MKNISLNFGALRDTIYNYSSKELMKENAKDSKVIRMFLKEIKENPIVKLQYLIFKNIEEGYFKKERLAERYINQNLKLLENVDWNKIIDTNKNLRYDMLKNYHVEGETEEKNKLYESIHVLIESTTRPNYFDINCSEESYEYVVNHLLKEKEIKKEEEENDMPKFFSSKYITELAVNNFNKRYSHLNEEERKLLKILLSTQENKINHLENIKNESLQLINSLYDENIDDETKNNLKQFEQKLNNLPITNEENINEIIINCSELNETLKEI